MWRQKMGHWLRLGGKVLLIGALVLTLTLSQASNAWAARTGGRMGGGSFRSAPSRSFSAPGRGYSRSGPMSPGRATWGGGFGFPFLIPFFGFGGGFGGIFSLLIGLALLNFLVNAWRNSGIGGGSETSNLDTVAVAQVQVGMTTGARSLQPELNRLAQTVDTSSASGRSQLLQEACLALLRHPEYWVYGAATATVTHLEQAEAQFNQYSLAERSKFTTETLSNLDNQVRELSLAPETATQSLAEQVREDVGEYLIVTLLVGTQGQLKLPAINNPEDLQQALQTLGAVGSDRLLAIEVLWTPQAEGDTLSTEDVLAYYPNLSLV